jgi:hypothetical protein
MYNEDDDLVNDLRETLEDLGMRNIDEAPYEVLPGISQDYLSIDDLNDFADRTFG